MAELFANVGRKSGKLLFTANRICELINNHQTVAVCDVDGIHEVAPIVRCKDCEYRGNKKKCILAFVVDKQGLPVSFYDNNGQWFCADGKAKEGEPG